MAQFNGTRTLVDLDFPMPEGDEASHGPTYRYVSYRLVYHVEVDSADLESNGPNCDLEAGFCLKSVAIRWPQVKRIEWQYTNSNKSRSLNEKF